MVNKLTSVLFFTLLLSFTYCTTYVTNPVRTNTVLNLCASFASRDQIVSSADTAEADQYRQLMKTTFSVTGYPLFYSEMISSRQQSRKKILKLSWPHIRTFLKNMVFLSGHLWSAMSYWWWLASAHAAVAAALIVVHHAHAAGKKKANPIQDANWFGLELCCCWHSGLFWQQEP